MTLQDETLVRRSYRVPVVGAGTPEDPYRPLLPAALGPGEGWAARGAFSPLGTVDVEVLAKAAAHAALQVAPGLTPLS